MFWGWIIMFLGWNFFRANPLVEVVSSGITLIDTYNDTLNYLENCWRDIYFALVGGAATHHRKVFTEFCKSSNHKSVNELIQLENMDRVRQGAIHMPESYGNTTKPKRCVVTLSGPRNGIIIFKHQRLNSASGPCIRENIISNTIHEGPCLEQRVYFNRSTKITLIMGKQIQPGFVIYFTGIVKAWLKFSLVFIFVLNCPLLFWSPILLGDSITRVPW